jgi:hypothetical protein
LFKELGGKISKSNDKSKDNFKKNIKKV